MPRHDAIEISETLIPEVIQFLGKVIDWYEDSDTDRKLCDVYPEVWTVKKVHIVTLRDAGPCPLRLQLSTDHVRVLAD